MDISFIIITFNDGPKLSKAISSAARAASSSNFNYEIWVVDNGSQDTTLLLLSEFKQTLQDKLQVIPLSRNTGTTYSRNRALEKAKGDIICVLDSDAEILTPDLRPLAAYLHDHPKAGILGPRIIMPDGSIYNSAKRFPTLADKLLKLPSILWGAAPNNRDWYPDFPFERTRTVHSVISCCWFFRKELYRLIGPLDENIFYAPEDVDYCLRSWKAGRPVVYFPHLKVLHHTKQVSHKKPFSKTALSHLKGLLYYYRKHRYAFSRRRLQKLFEQEV